MSCSNRNMQNIPKKGRLGKLHECVVASKGERFIKADYSQIEFRIAANITGEEPMLKAYRESGDLHDSTARKITGREEISKDDRQHAKAINFGPLYGQRAEGLRDYARDKFDLNNMSLEEAK